jgi:cytoskeleton protein RodZ
MGLFQRIGSRLAVDVPESGSGSQSSPSSAGELLRQRREALGLDLGDVAAALKIKPAYLGSLEAGRPDQLPGPAYASGFVRAYGDHLGLDGKEILRRFRLEAAGLDAKSDLSFPMPLGERSMPGRRTLLAALILTVCAYGSWYYLSAGERSRPERVAEVPAMLLPPKIRTSRPPPVSPPAAAAAEATSTGRPSDGLPVSSVSAAGRPVASRAAAALPAPPASSAGSTPILARLAAGSAMPGTVPIPVPPSSGIGSDAAASPSPGPPAETQRTYGAVDGSARIVLHVIAESWIEVRDAAGSVLFTGVLEPGENYQVPDRPGVEMRTGNAGGLQITLDGRPLPALGALGAVRRHVVLDPQALASGTAIHD